MSASHRDFPAESRDLSYSSRMQQATTLSPSWSDVRMLLGLGLAAIMATASLTHAAEPTSKRDRLEGIPLVWKPTIKPSSLRAIDTTGLKEVRLQVAPFTDQRANPQVIAQNREEGQPRDVVTVNDVAAFVTERLKRVMGNAGMSVVDSAPTHVLEGEVRRFFVDEKARYNGEVEFDLVLKDGAGRTLWTGSANGAATRFGRSYKADNYYEVLSDSLMQAGYSLLGNPTFHAALTKQ